MNNEPVAWYDNEEPNGIIWKENIELDNGTPLYTHPAEHDLGIAEAIGFEKGHESASTMLREQQDEIKALKERLEFWVKIADKERLRADRNEQ